MELELLKRRQLEGNVCGKKKKQQLFSLHLHQNITIIVSEIIKILLEEHRKFLYSQL